MQLSPPPSSTEAGDWLERLFDEPVACPPTTTPSTPVALYGAGELGGMAVDLLSRAGVPVAHILDRAARPGAMLKGVPMLRPGEKPSDPALTLLVTTVSAPFGDIRAALVQQGWKSVLPFYDYALGLSGPLNNGWFAGELSPDDKTEIRACAAGFADDTSRAAYLQFLAWRVLRRDWRFKDAPVDKTSRYWIEPILASMSKAERFIDAGAYDGRVFRRFLSETSGRFETAHLFEPDRVNCDALWTTVAALPTAPRAKVVVRQEALSNRRGRAGFDAGHGYASAIGDGPDIVDTVRLDDLDLAPTFVKMHLEGGELAAIAGAAETFRTARPKLAVTVYHSRDGLWRIPRLLMRMLQGYSFYFRLHAWCATGAVVYGVPHAAS